ncbi:MAG: hypothetical protein QOF37_2628 [Thermoleophilaceae bacterium]|nr:hypothetical protein [Thermoleophilaceae bacterium]
MTRPEVDEILLADPPLAWEQLGFTVLDGVVPLGGVRIRLGVPGEGIVGWTLRGDLHDHDLDGLPTSTSDAGPPEPVEHPIAAAAVDHVVALTPDFDRTVGRLRAAGLDYRATRDAGNGHRQAFFVVGPCLLELGGPSDGDVRFWGLTLVVDDLDAAAARLGDRLGAVKEAVQPGRRIATLRREAGLGVPLALMTPRQVRS